jgi:hypothetical protein
MATVLEACSTEDQRSVVGFLWAKGFEAKDIHKAVHSWVEKCGKRFADDEVETVVWKWLRQQSEDYYAMSFDALVIQWGKYINVGEGHVKK